MSSISEAERRRTVFVVHGRNQRARNAMFAFLRSLGLKPVEWSRARADTGKASPYIGEILDAGFESAQAVVVLFTPDELVSLRREYASGDDDPEVAQGMQARPNVIFEAGIALGRNPDRVIFVEMGQMRPFSDLTGRHSVRVGTDTSWRHEMAQRLRTAGCEVDQAGTDWMHAGSFEIPSALPTSPLGRVDSSMRGSPSSDAPITSAEPVTPPSDGWTRSGDFQLRAGVPKRGNRGQFRILGVVRNDGPPIQMMSISATYRDAEDNSIGKASTVVMQITQGEEKDFELNTSDDLDGYVSCRLQVDTAV